MSKSSGREDVNLPFLQGLLHKLWSIRFIRYTAMAGVGFVTHFLTFYLCIRLEVSAEVTNVAAMIAGALIELPLHFLVSFSDYHGPKLPAVIKYIVPRFFTGAIAQWLYLLMLPVVYDLMFLLGFPRGWAPPVSSFLSLLVIFFLNFVYNLTVTFGMWHLVIAGTKKWKKKVIELIS